MPRVVKRTLAVTWQAHQFQLGSGWKRSNGRSPLSPSRSPDAGLVRGKHFTSYVDEVKKLRRGGDDHAAERLLLELVDATESESTADGLGVAPWYYEQLAILYRRRGEPRNEIAILERYARQKHAPGAKPPRLLERLDKARAAFDLRGRS